MSDRDPNNSLNLRAIFAKVDEAEGSRRRQRQGDEKEDSEDHPQQSNLEQMAAQRTNLEHMSAEHDDEGGGSVVAGDDGERVASMPPSSLFAYASGSLNGSVGGRRSAPAAAEASAPASLDYAAQTQTHQEDRQHPQPPNRQSSSGASSGRSLFGDASISLNSILDALPIPGVGSRNERAADTEAQAQPNNDNANTSGRSHPTSITNSNSASATGDEHADDVSNTSVPSAILNAKSTNDVKMATYRSKINEIMTSHQAEARELRQTICDLERDNANLTERIDVVLEDIDDRHAISEYAQFLVNSRPSTSSSSSIVAAPESAYVLRLQSQLTKAMHKMGVLANQIDLLQQQSDDAVADLRDEMMAQSNAHAEMERQCLNDLVDMERDMVRVRQRFEEELTKRKEESRTKIHKLKDDARRWRDVAEDMRRDNQALKKATAKASAAAAAAAKNSLQDKTDDDTTTTTDSAVPNKMILDMQMEIIRLKKAHVAEINMLRQQATLKYAGDGSVVSAAAAATASATPAQKLGRGRSGSIDSDAATATSAATAQVSNVSAKDYHHSRGRPVPASITAGVSVASISVPPIDEQCELQMQQGKDRDVKEVQDKLMEQAKILHKTEASSRLTMVETKKKRSTKKMMTSALASGAATASSSSSTLASSSSSSTAARSRMKHSGGRQASSASMLSNKVGRRRAQSYNEVGSTATGEISGTATSSASSKSRSSGSKKSTSFRGSGARTKSHKASSRPRSVSPTTHEQSAFNMSLFHNSDPSLHYAESSSNDSLQAKKKNSTESSSSKSKDSPKKLQPGTSGDSPTVPLVNLPEKRSSIGRVA